MIVVVRKRVVDLRKREFVPVGHGLRPQAALFDAIVDVADRDTTTADVWLVVDV